MTNLDKKLAEVRERLEKASGKKWSDIVICDENDGVKKA